VLVLDEPANGLDLDGIRWLRDLLTALAAGGRTVLVSSHLLGEMEHLATRWRSARSASRRPGGGM
jgi:ABC-2 type transport system ATP-binding protein